MWRNLSVILVILATELAAPTNQIAFDEVSSLHIWLTVSSLVNKEPRDLLFRQIEINWINAPNDHPDDFIGLYLDEEPQVDSLPVSVHKLNGRIQGQVTSDFYLPKIDFYNETISRRRPTAASVCANSRTNLLADDEQQEAECKDNEAEVQLPADEQQQQQHQQRHLTARWHQQPAVGGSRERSRRAAGSELQLDETCLGYCVAYHSNGRVLARNCLRLRPQWMRDIHSSISSRPIAGLMLPGTHNSGTYSKQLDRTALQMINKYQMNQDENIFNQLLFGIRYLDLRLGYSQVRNRPEKLWIYHDIFRTDVSLAQVLDEVRKFLELTSHEILVVDFHRFTTGFDNEDQPTQLRRHKQVVELIYEKLADYLVPSYLGQNGPIGEYLALGKRVVVGYSERAKILTSQLSGADSIFALYKDTVLAADDQQAAARNSTDRNETTKFSSSNQIDSADGRAPLGRLLAANSQQQQQLILANYLAKPQQQQQQQQQQQLDKRVGTRIYNKLKGLKLISRSFSKRAAELTPPPPPADRLNSQSVGRAQGSFLARVALLFPAVHHLWPNKDTLDGLAQYMNQTTCRKYFGELRSMMVELTPTVFGAIADKYDGNRRLAQLVNRPVSDWIRDRWLHCLNLVASDFFLGNDLISLSLHANRMRMADSRRAANNEIQRSTSGPASQCKWFRRVGHLLDRTKVPKQFTILTADSQLRQWAESANEIEPTIKHSLGPAIGRIVLRPIPGSASFSSSLATPAATSGGGAGANHHAAGQQQSVAASARERRDSLVESVADGFVDLFASFKRLLNL